MRKVIDGFENFTATYPYPVLAIGNFDGVHLGHQAIFRKLVSSAQKNNGTSIVCTFEPHPLRILAPERAPKLLTPFKEKTRLMKKAGIDVVVCVNFTRVFANIRAEEFAREVLCGTIGVKEVFIGSNYRFGKGRKGSPELLKRLGKECGYRVTVVDEVVLNGKTVSSSLIRTLVAKGLIDEASPYLGRNYSVVGIVIEGSKRGKSLLNMPTANIAVYNELLPKDGVYAVTVECDRKTYAGAANIGNNPTFQDKKFSFEVHILRFHREIVGKTLRVNFIRRIRDEIKFSSATELKAQMHADVNTVREIISQHAR